MTQTAQDFLAKFLDIGILAVGIFAFLIAVVGVISVHFLSKYLSQHGEDT